VATTITFNDGSPGDAHQQQARAWRSLQQLEPRRLDLWREEESLGTGTLYTFSFRNEYLVTFELRQIPQSQMAIMLRLQRHLKSGGTIAVNTGDATSHSYPTCCLQKGADPSPRLSDPKNLEYSMTFALRNIAGSPVDFICQY
jgi:hypothetical protein